MLRNLTLDGKVYLRDDKKASFASLAMAGQHGQRHARRAHQPEAVSDWLNPFSLGPCQPPLTCLPKIQLVQLLTRNSQDRFKYF